MILMPDTRKPGLILAGPYYYPFGYGAEARGFIGILDRGFFNLRILPTHLVREPGFLTPEQETRYTFLENTPVDLQSAAVVQHCAPDAFSANIQGWINIARTMFDTDRIPQNSVARCNQMNEIWVPSHFNLETFSSSGVASQKLQVVPGGVDVNIFHPAAPPMELREKRGFVFLSNFGWIDRKGWDILLTAYCTEFKADEDVMLLIKTFMYLPGIQIEEQCKCLIEDLHLQHPAPSFFVINSDMPVNLMPGLYTACDAFVLPSRGEGWGLPYLEAMASARPVIGTRWSGNLDYMNEENSYLIDIEGLEDVSARVDMGVYLGHKWARPSVEHLRHLMRHVFEHRQEARERGARARSDVCQNWTWDHTATAVMREWAKFHLQSSPINIPGPRKPPPKRYTPAPSPAEPGNTVIKGNRRVPPLGSLRRLPPHC